MASGFVPSPTWRHIAMTLLFSVVSVRPDTSVLPLVSGVALVDQVTPQSCDVLTSSCERVSLKNAV